MQPASASEYTQKKLEQNVGVSQPNNMWDESDEDDDQEANQWGVQPLATEIVEESQRGPNK